MSRALSISVLAATLLLGGCKHLPPPQRVYNGPTQTMAQVVRAINANNQQIPSLWCRHNFEADLIDQDGKKHFLNGDGVLLYRPPRDLLFRGNKDVAGKIFEIGSNRDRFWVQLIPQSDTMWWGRHANAGKPCMGEIPLRPDLLLEVLGVGRIGEDFLAEPAPTMRFNNDADAYMLTWIALNRGTGPRRWTAQKEIWYDRQTLLPRLVLLFDENGRVLLRAQLSKHQLVGQASAAGAVAPLLASDYRLYFPDNGSTMWITLREMAFSRRGAPDDRAFEFPQQPGVNRIVQVDEPCDK